MCESLLENQAPLLGRVRRVPALAEQRPRFICLDELLQILERDAEQIAQADKLPQPGDIRVRVEAMLAACASCAGS